MSELEQERKNRELMEALLQVLAAQAKRLTPEVEPALTYGFKEDRE